MTSSGIRYSNIDALHETSARCGPTGVISRPSLNQCSCDTWRMAMATKARETRFRGQRVVVGRVAPAFGDVVADREQMALAIEEKVELGAVDELLERRRECAPPCLPWRCRIVVGRPLRMRQVRGAARRSSPPRRRATRWRSPPVASPAGSRCCASCRRAASTVDFRRHRLEATRSKPAAPSGVASSRGAKPAQVGAEIARAVRGRGQRRPARHRARRDRACRTTRPESGDRSTGRRRRSAAARRRASSDSPADCRCRPSTRTAARAARAIWVSYQLKKWPRYRGSFCSVSTVRSSCVRHCVGGDVAEIPGRDRRHHLQADVGGRRAMRDRIGPVLLIVVGHEPVVGAG